MSGIRIERPSVEQWERWRGLRLAALGDTPDAFGSTLAEERDQPPSFWQARLTGAAITLVATLHGRDAGISVVAPSGAEGVAGLYSVWVAPFARGRKVGDALVRAAIEAATAAGYERIVLDVGDHNLPARRLYARWGFQPTGRRSALPPPRQAVTELELARALAPRR